LRRPSLRLLLILFALFAVPLLAQEGEEAAEPNELLYKSINFAILAAGLGWLIAKKGGPALAARAEAIQRALKAADQIRADAAAEVAQIEKKFASLDSQVERLRSESRKEMEAERARIEAETRALVQRLQENMQSEIASMTRHAELELRAVASQLAMQLAQDKVQRRLTPETDAALLAGFVADLKQIQGEARN
jgi:F-type H+-transporting ATPase subunit b